jgi:hypothetical protein
MNQDRPDLSAIVVNWNGGEMLLRCLQSLLAAAQGMSAGIWLVDNASGDGSAERAIQTYPEVRLIRNDGNLGFARAANQALAQAAGAYLLLLNPDVQIGREALTRMLGVMRGDSRIGIAGCPSVDGQGRRVPGYELSFPGQRRAAVSQSEGEVQEVAWVSGACLLARRAMAQAIGFLDPGFFMYYEDVDWCYRARAAGWRVVTIPAALVRHELGSSSAQAPAARAVQWAAGSRLRFYQKHYSRRRARWLKVRLQASALAQVLWRLLPSAFSQAMRAELRKELAYLRAAVGSHIEGHEGKR